MAPHSTFMDTVQCPTARSATRAWVAATLAPDPKKKEAAIMAPFMVLIKDAASLALPLDAAMLALPLDAAMLALLMGPIPDAALGALPKPV